VVSGGPFFPPIMTFSPSHFSPLGSGFLGLLAVGGFTSPTPLCVSETCCTVFFVCVTKISFWLGFCDGQRALFVESFLLRRRVLNSYLPTPSPVRYLPPFVKVLFYVIPFAGCAVFFS